MSDPLGLVSGSGGASPLRPNQPLGAQPKAEQNGPAFGDVLMENLERVGELNADASRAIEDLATGQRDDVEGVILATQKADNAFRMLQAVRNKVVEAMAEVQQMRV
ncbi:MAG: flagellar hook-basal body complex protein FliE [Planctomycetota bacterium]